MTSFFGLAFVGSMWRQGSQKIYSREGKKIFAEFYISLCWTHQSRPLHCTQAKGSHGVPKGSPKNFTYFQTTFSSCQSVPEERPGTTGGVRQAQSNGPLQPRDSGHSLCKTLLSCTPEQFTRVNATEKQQWNISEWQSWHQYMMVYKKSGAGVLHIWLEKGG